MKNLKLPARPLQTILKLKNAGFECYAVGGCMRDLLLYRETKDWDFTTNATPDEIMNVFPDNSFYENRFGTVGLKIPDEKNVEEIYEITTYRAESKYNDRRHPTEVLWGVTLEDDLNRRDFTINAVAYDGEKLVDTHNGIHDLTNKLVRAVGDPEKRFEEDALRLLRAVRIATQLGFTIEKHTSDAIIKYAAHIHDVSAERIHDELLKLLASTHPADGILLLKNHNLLYEIIPEFKEAFNTQQKSPKRHHIYDVGTHLIESLRHCQSPDTIVRLATLLHDIGKPATYNMTADGVITFFNHEIIGASIVRNIAHRLRLSRDDTGKLIRLVRWHQFSVEEHQTDSAIRRFIRKVGIETIPDMLELRRADRLGGGATETSWRTELFKKRLIDVQKQPFSVKDLKVDGNDVMKLLNESPSPFIGTVLKQLFDEVVEKKIENDKKVLVERIKLYRSHSN